MKTTKNVGVRIKQLRELKSISLYEMSTRSGLELRQIETVEETGVLPSLGPLMKISRVLGVRPGTLLDDFDEQGPAICRKDQYENSISFSDKDLSTHRHMDYFSLSSTKLGRHMEPFIIQIEKGKENMDFIPSTHEGEEFIYCLDGVVEIRYGDKTYQLEKGDSIYYDSVVEHSVRACNESGARILAVIYTPV